MEDPTGVCWTWGVGQYHSCSRGWRMSRVIQNHRQEVKCGLIVSQSRQHRSVEGIPPFQAVPLSDMWFNKSICYAVSVLINEGLYVRPGGSFRPISSWVHG